MTKIYPVLLAGGSGTRLWPLSRKSYPKQFSNLIGDRTLFQSSAERLTSSNSLEFAPHITLTNSDLLKYKLALILEKTILYATKIIINVPNFAMGVKN